MNKLSSRIVTHLLLALSLLISSTNAHAASMADYCVMPPFIATTVPPLVMFEMGRDHKLFYEAYNDSADLDEDGVIDNTYKHSIDYYGYFDPYKCYTYNTTGTNKFIPASHTSTKFCSSAGGQWSGNILNWLSMSRIDVLKKVLYGGHRSTDSTSDTILERATVPQDAHSWGKEFTGRLCYNASGTPQYSYSCSINSDCSTGYSCVDKSNELVGFNQAGLSSCSAASPGTVNNKMLVVRYNHPAALTAAQQAGDSHTDLLASFADTAEPLTSTFIDYDTSITNFGTTASKLDPTQDHLNNYGTMVVAEFKTSTGSGSETWQFMVDSDDGAEVEIFTTAGVSLGVVASHYGAHSSCSTAPTTLCGGMVTGSLSLAKSSTWYRLVVRQAEKAGDDGVRVWYKKGTAGWKLFGTTELGNNNMRTFDITSSNACTLLASEFINQGKPTSGATSQDSSKFHMVCNTTLSDTGAPLMRLRKNVSGKRIWDWASKERPVCDNSLGVPDNEYEVRVRVCDSTIDTTDQLDIKKNEIGDSCKWYPGSGTGVWKPIGLMQQYGEGDGSKVCSKNMSKSCNTDAGCSFATEGKCMDKADMYFGMFTTSYMKNTSGGVLRKNIGAILDESNANNGIFQSSENAQGNIILTMDRLKPVGFRYSDWSYQDATGGSCGWITGRSLLEGECRSWGNPIAEMFYESLRYYAGRLTPTAEFTYSTAQDSGLSLSKPSWGYPDGSVDKPLYDVFPACAKPFILLLSDTNTSYDSDQIPGSSFTKPDGTTFTEDTPTILKLADTQSSGRSLLNELTHTIGQTEGINNTNRYIGESGTDNNFLCTPKTVTSLSLLRGMCPEEPTKKGSYYVASLAYYGKTEFKNKTGKPDINTFVVALSSPFSELKIKTASGTISVLPTAKSVSGQAGVYTSCAQRMNLTYDATYGLKLLQKSPVDTAAYCPTNTVVDYYVDDIRYDSSKNVTYALFRINFEDVEQGADHDMDSIVRYEICTATAAAAQLGSCGSSTLGADQIEIKLFSDYAAGGIDQVMGFVISGTTEDGVYLPVKDADVGGADADTPAVVADLPLIWSKEFTIGATSASSLKNPLWYAAKWGGFVDKNSNKIPDLRSEWANDCTASDISQCDPDNYYPVVNPLKLRQQLNKALTDILRRVSSGTAASILNNSEGSGATLLQAIFYPKKSYENLTELSWSGELMNLWYYVDPFFNLSTIREDTDYSSGSHVMDITNDKRVQFYFDDSESQTKIKRYNSNGTTELADFNPDVTGGLKTIWTAGKKLWKRDLSTEPRTIYTTTNSSSFTNFNTTNAAILSSYLNAEGADATAKTAFATNVINYTLGTDVCLDTTSPCTNKSRNRTVDIKMSDTTTESHVWKLGDIISSTPKIQGGVALQTYDLKSPLGYNDSTYKDFYSTDNYKNRGMVYVGANDGMLHAFKLGKMQIQNYGTQKAILSGENLGREEWAYVPKHSMPYLKYLTLPEYDNNHLYLVDGTNSLFDVSTKTTTVRDDYWNETRTSSTWKTVLLGGMGLGGASKAFNNACSAGTTAGTCVKAPFDTVHGISSYFAIDVTNQDFVQDSNNNLRAQPTLLWEFSHPEMGFSTSGPAIIRINSKLAASPYTVQSAKNGRWFAVFASGPTGPIDTALKQFKGKSDQNLKLFVVDIDKGPVVDADPKKNGLWIIDTGITEAFAGSITNNAVVDAEMVDGTSENLRQDDVVYIGYTKKATDGTWTDGGVLRLVIPESAHPDTMDITTWKTSKVIDGIGPVTTTVGKLMSKNNLYLFFGTGRYYYPQDDMSLTRSLFMVKEKCYPVKDAGGNYVKSDIISNCDSSNAAVATLAKTDLTSKNTPSSTAVANGWYIDLSEGERIVTDTVATVNGAVFFTSYKPTGDVCGFGGKSYLWGVKYDTGDTLPASAKKGKILIQLSTGSFAEVDLSTALTDQGNRRTAESSALSFGKASADPGLFMTSAGLAPVKRILHIQERYK